MRIRAGRKMVGIAVLLGSFASTAGAVTVTTLVNNGSTSRRIDLVVMGDRYTSADMARFRTDVDKVVARFKAQSPWKEYWSYVNVHRVEVVSQSNTSAGPLGSNLSNGRCWFADTNAVNNYAALAPDNEIRLVLVNSTTYGGCATFGGIAVTYNGTYVDWAAVHETGHQFGWLADEYNYGGGDTYTGSEPTEPNATRNLDRATTKWRRWIASTTPIPTPTSYTVSVGLFEGCDYYVHGIYRPKLNCLMKSLPQAFCEICREQIVKKLYTEGNPVNGIASSSGGFTVPRNASTNLTAVEIAPHALGYAWYVDGAYKSNAATFTFSGGSFAIGTHTVKVVVTDLTPFVRGATLQGSYQRSVSVSEATASAVEAIKVNTSSLNVRSGPSTADAILGKVSSGQIFISSATLSSGWRKISYEGKTGYVSSAYVVKVTGVTGVKINASTLNVRNGAGTGYTKIGEAHLGEIYRVESSSAGWYKIRWSGTSTGWVSGSYVVAQAF